MIPSDAPPPAAFVLNARTLGAPQSGVQRYTRELANRLGAVATRVAPTRRAQGVAGHLWEQLILPLRCRGRLLFSPGNTGPLLHRRQVVTIHDASTFDQPEAFTGLFGRWYRWLLPRLARRAQGIITVSQFSRDRLAATLGIPAKKIAVVYNGVTPPPPAPSPVELAATRERLDLAGKFLLCVGSRDPRKNLERLVAAFVAADLAGYTLVLAGGGNPRLFSSAPAATTRARARVRELGHVDEPTLEALYALAAGFVFPSLYEGFGLPPLEAMARGCPVLCSDATSLPEVCGRPFTEGGACLYFSPHDPAAITAALRTFVQLPAAHREGMIAAGRRQAARFTWDRCARETAAVVTEFAALAEPRPATTAARRPVDC
jgi:glycosyltransferase involved in cell wall biosynthesis